MDSWAAAAWLTLAWHLGGPLAPGTRVGWCRHLHANLRRSWGPRPVNSHIHTRARTPTHTHTHAHTKKTSPSARTGGFQSQRGQFTGDQKSRLKITPVLGPKSIFCGSPTASSTGHVGPCAEIRFLALVTHYSRNLSFTMGLGGLKRNVKRPPQTGTKANFSSTHARTSRESTFPFLLTQTFSPNDGERIFHGVSPPRRWSHRKSWDGFKLPASVCAAADSLSPRPDGSYTQICIHFPLISSEIAGQLHLLSNTV